MKKRNITKAALAVLSVMTIGAGGAAFAACGDDDVHEHSYGSWTIVNNPTLESGGTAERYCSDNDGGKETYPLPALTDTAVWTERTADYTAPTHTTEGSRTFSSEFGTVTITVPKTDDHSFGSWTITKQPTMTETGKAERTCSATDAYKETATVPALSDASVWTEKTDEAVAPTHTTDGKKVFTSVYGKVTLTLPADSDAHTYGSWTITDPPTLTEGGKAKRVCTDTDKHEDEIEIPALSDTTVWTENKGEYVPPTHTTAGKQVYTSEYGNVTVTLPANADAHNFGAWTFVEGERPTIENGGRIQRTCTDTSAHSENFTVYETVPALSDKSFWTENVKTRPTHLTDGVADYVNRTYDVAVTEVAIPKIAHTFGGWTITKEPTSSATGEAVRVCTENGCSEDASATEKFALPALSDASFWTKGEEVKADYNHAGSITYTNAVYGSVTVITSPKLSTPYDNKTYSSVNVRLSDGKINLADTWNTAFLQVGDDGIGYGTGYPFRGKFVFEYVNPETGLVKITQYGYKTGSSGGDTDWGEAEDYALRAADEYEETGIEYYAYVDKDTGVLVIQANGWTEVNIAVPSEAVVGKSAFEAATCDGDFVISYTRNTTPLNMFVDGDGVLFGVKFITLEKTEITAAECFTEASDSCTTFIVAGDEIIKGYAMNVTTEKWGVSDGLEGYYKLPDGKTVLIQGGGYIAVDSEDGEYKIISDNVVGVIITDKLTQNSVYYEFTLSGAGMSAEGGTCTQAAPKVTLTLDFNGYFPDNQTQNVTLEGQSKFVPIQLPPESAMTHQTMTFKGWYLDAACTIEVELIDGAFIPESDVTLYARWAEKVVIKLEGLLADDQSDETKNTLYLGEGDVISEYLTLYKKYDIDASTNTYFYGWYIVTDDSEIALEEGATVGAGDSGTTITAKWVAVPAYVGSYSGANTYNKDNCVGGKAIKITVDGKISGKFTGEVLSYDEATQLMTVKIGNTTRYFVYDMLSGILVTGDNESKCSNPIDPDMDVFSSKQPTATLGLTQNKGYDVRIVDVENKVGTDTVLFYGNKIYADITVTDSFGNVLTAKTMKTAKTVVIRYKKNDTIILAVASKGDSFNADNNVKSLDEYFGTYTGTDGDIALDGTGSFIWGEKSGTYVTNGGSLGLFVVSEGVNTEYWDVTLSEKAYTAVKPEATVTVTAVAPAGTTLPDEIAAFNVNININNFASLPDGASFNTAFVFNGYFKDAECTEKIEDTFILTENATIYAKYSNPASLTLVFNDGETQDETIRYSVGDSAVIDVPVYNKHAFVGWFLKDGSADGDWGDEWVSGSTVTENLTVYAKWTAAPLFNDIYAPIRIYGKDVSGVSGKDDRSSNAISVDPYGNAEATAYPFSGAVEIAYVENSTTKLTVKVGNSVYNAAIDPETGLIVMAASSGVSTKISEVWLLNNKETGSIYDKISSSYWNGGKNRAIEYAFDADTTYRIYISDGEVYFGVSFKDAATGGNDIDAKDCYKASALYVIGADGSTVIEQPSVTVTFDMNGHGANETITINKFFAQDLTAKNPTAEGFVFRGWYTDAEYKSKADDTYVTGENATLYAKWDAQAEVTFHVNAAGHNDVVYGDGYVNDKIGADNLPEIDYENDGKAFAGWFTKDGADGDWGAEVTGDTVISGVTLDVYAKWVTPAAMAGTYKGWNLYRAGENGTKIIASQSTTFTMGVAGEYAYSSTKGTLSDADISKTSGAINVGKYAYVDKSVGVIWYAYGSNASSVGNDTCLLFNAELVKEVVYSGLKTNPYTFWATVKFVDASKPDVNVFGYDNKIYTGVSWGSQTADKCHNTNHIVSASDGSVIAVLKDGNVVELDGYQGTYTFEGTTIVVDGGGTLTVGASTSDSYVISDGKLVFAHNNRMHVISVDKENGSFAYVQDGYAGEYTLPEGGTITLDGLGRVTGTTKTYVVSGTSISVYDGEAVTKYGIDVENKQFLGKSAFAGLTFNGTYKDSFGDSNNCTITFNDEATIVGKIDCGYYGAFEFTGELKGNELTMTLTKAIGSGVGQTVIMTVSGNKLTRTGGTYVNNAYITNDFSATCDGFSL